MQDTAEKFYVLCNLHGVQKQRTAVVIFWARCAFETDEIESQVGK